MEKRLKSKIVAVALTFLFCLSAILSIFFAPFTVEIAHGENGANGLRFKQVVLGEDFAVGLTYDGDLYGWNLFEESRANGLGLTDYSTNPKKIDVTFVQGPASNNNTVTMNYTPLSSNEPGDEILKIAATRTSAAFITKKGHIYTWGKNILNSSDDSSNPAFGILLQQEATTASFVSKAPTIIDYATTDTNLNQLKSMVYQTTTESVTSEMTREDGNLLDIVGGDDNYVVKHYRMDGAQKKIYYFGWGSNKYFTTGAPSSTDSLRAQMFGFVSEVTSSSADSDYNALRQSVSVGGGTVLIGNSTGFYVRGKNYYIPTSGDYTYKVGQTAYTTSGGSDNPINVLYPEKLLDLVPTSAITSGTRDEVDEQENGAFKDSTNTVRYSPYTWTGSSLYIKSTLTPVSGSSSDTVYAFDEAFAVNNVGGKAPYDFYSPKQGDATALEPAMSTVQFSNSQGVINKDVYVDTLSVGNGYGYFIRGNYLYFFGNGYNGQSGQKESVTRKAYDSIYQIPVNANTFTGRPVSVVAGKTTMGRPLFSEVTTNGTEGSFNATGRLALTENSGGTVTASFASAFMDGTEFLSGMTTEDSGVGDVYVWNASKGFTSLKNKFKDDFGIDGSAENRIIRLSGGYGNHLVALSSVGKIYQISYNNVDDDFDIELKDVFLNSSGAKQQNYAINNSNEINFLRSTGRPSTAAEEAGYDYSLNAVIDLNGKTDSETGVSDNKYSAVVSDNMSGDAFRILTPSDSNLPHRTITRTTTLVSSTSENIPADGTPQFFFEGSTGTPISSEILSHYLSYRIISDNATGSVSIEITPYQSTQNATIIMRYFIGRYRSEADTLKSHDSDYLFYDFDVVETKITIANTEAEFNRFDNRLNGDGSNISIPVLDPNNSKNKTYSIALTNVQYGLDKLAEKFDVDNASKFSEYVVEQAYTNDAGFPASKRVDDANLSAYYINGGDADYNADSYYTDKYQYFAFDTDGDTISYESNSEPFAGTRNYLTCLSQPIELLIPIDDASAGFELPGIKTGTSTTLAAYNERLRDFNNIYGFTASVVERDGKLMLRVSYRVLQFTAIASTNNLEYVDNDMARPNMRGEISNTPHYQIYLAETYYDRSEGENTKNYNENSILVPAYAQSSLVIETVDGSNNPVVYRAAEGYNVYTVNVPQLTVGSSTSKYTFRLPSSGLFKDNANIYLTQKSRSVENKYNEYSEFINQFDKNDTAVTLTRDEFTFEAYVAGMYNNIRIEVRRFASSTMDTPVKTRDVSGNLVDEMITLVFNINVVKSSFESNGLKNDRPTRDTISGEKVYQIGAFTDEPDTTFVAASSSNTGTASVKIATDGKSVTVTPYSSGTVIIELYIKQYGKAVEAYIELNVQSRSIMDGVLSLKDSKQYYLSDLKSVIANSYNGAFVFENFELDKDDTAVAPNGYYFVQRETGASDWETITGLPSFIESVKVNKDDNGINDNDVVLTLGLYDEKDIQGKEFMFVVKFKGVGASAGSRFETGIKLRPAKVVLTDKDSGGDLVINVTMSHGRVVIEDGLGSAANQDKEYRAKLLDILRSYASGVIESPASFSIQFAKPMYEDAFNYFDIYNTSDTLVIAPLKNTEKEQLVNVLITSGTEDYVLSLKITISGIIETLPVETYRNVWIICAILVFLLMFIVFMVRMGIYWKKKAEQKRIIRKNQMLIKMRDKVHNKSDSISKEQLVQTKLKLQDPKYAKMFNDMKKAAQKRDGINLDDSDGGKKSKKKDKKKNKQSIADMRAELEARREANAKMQMDNQMPISDIPVEPGYGTTVEPMTFGAFDVPDGGVSDVPIGDKLNSDDNILFDVETLDDNK